MKYFIISASLLLSLIPAIAQSPYTSDPIEGELGCSEPALHEPIIEPACDPVDHAEEPAFIPIQANFKAPKRLPRTGVNLGTAYLK